MGVEHAKKGIGCALATPQSNHKGEETSHPRIGLAVAQVCLQACREGEDQIRIIHHPDQITITSITAIMENTISVTITQLSRQAPPHQ